MTVREAATMLGCSASHVRTLIARGLLDARPFGRSHDISARSVMIYQETPQKQGFPRGNKRKGPRGPAI